MDNHTDNGQSVFLTKEGLQELKDEYERLVSVDRVAVAERIARAREFGDLSENAEYDAAKDQQSYVEGRIMELEKILAHVQVIKHPRSANIVDVGTTVTVEIDGDKDTYTIVGSLEAKPESGKISHESPVGRALMGLKVGDKVLVELPNGKLNYKVIKISA